MSVSPVPDTDRAARLFAVLRDKTFDGVGVTRAAYGPGEQIAHELTRSEAEELGLEVAVDAAGNLYMTLPGSDRSAKGIVLGSHLDSVPEGGNFDGAAGVFAGLAVLAGMREAGFRPRCDITVLAIRAEEAGAWFPISYPGSRAALGRLPAEALAVRRLDSGLTLEQHMRDLGFDPGTVRAARGRLSAANTMAFVELHIEQGPLLEAAGVPVGIVTAIPGSRRLRAARASGAFNHSGATPRPYRRDALIAVAELAHRLDEYWAALETRGHRLTCTFCVLGTTEEAGFGKIAGEARFQLDVRSVQPASVDAMFLEMHRLVGTIEARRGVRFELGQESTSEPSLMDAGVQRELVRAAQSAGIGHRVMQSGAGHDAAAFAQAGVPAGMLFVRNQNGSHNPHEAMRMEDFAAGCAVLARWATAVAG